jgi:hypothetical protein
MNKENGVVERSINIQNIKRPFIDWDKTHFQNDNDSRFNWRNGNLFITQLVSCKQL